MKIFAGYSSEVVVMTADIFVVVEVMIRHHIVSMKMYDSDIEAYCALAREYVETYGMRARVPQMEHLLNNSYAEYAMGHCAHGYGQENRIFAIVTDRGSTVATDFQYIGEFLTAYKDNASYLEIREFKNNTEAAQWINGTYIKYIAPYLAYIPAPCDILGNIEVNKTYPVIDYRGFIDKYKSNIPQELFSRYSLPDDGSVKLLPNLNE